MQQLVRQFLVAPKIDPSWRVLMKVKYMAMVATVSLLSVGGVVFGCANPCASQDPNSTETTETTDPCGATSEDPCGAKSEDPCGAKSGDPCAGQ